MVMVWHSVLILVVVEDGLAHADAWKQMQSRQVLILIIVDNGLVRLDLMDTDLETD